MDQPRRVRLDRGEWAALPPAPMTVDAVFGNARVSCPTAGYCGVTETGLVVWDATTWIRSTGATSSAYDVSCPNAGWCMAAIAAGSVT
jgi:hypothetical protein